MFWGHFVSYLFRRERVVQIVLAFLCGLTAVGLTLLPPDGGISLGIGLTLAYVATHIFGIINVEWPAYKMVRASTVMIRHETFGLLKHVKNILGLFKEASSPDGMPGSACREEAQAAVSAIMRLNFIRLNDITLIGLFNTMEQALLNLNPPAKGAEAVIKPAFAQEMLASLELCARKLWKLSLKDKAMRAMGEENGFGLIFGIQKKAKNITGKLKKPAVKL